MIQRNDRCVVDNRAFLLGLDQLYREAIQEHERRELLSCARDVAAALRLAPRPVLVEGYYSSDDRLSEYFRLMRTLQAESAARIPEVRSLLSYQRLCQVLSSPLFGEAVHEDTLLPTGRDALSHALHAVCDWSLPSLTAAAHGAALEHDDCSLVGLAAWLQDAVVITALRESVVLHAELVLGALEESPVGWEVDPELAERAARFIAAFRALFGTELPAPIAENAYGYWWASQDDHIAGRCVRLGADNPVEPTHYYHWAIDSGAAGELVARDFWHLEAWTTDRYRRAVARRERPLNALGEHVS